jgi:hypothetical protein
MAASCSILGAEHASCKHAEHGFGSQVHKQVGAPHSPLSNNMQERRPYGRQEGT